MIILFGFWMKKILFLVDTSVACAVGPSVTTSSTDFSVQNLVFGNSFEFSAAEIHFRITISHILNPNLTK
jgi:hypothetical protein